VRDDSEQRTALRQRFAAAPAVPDNVLREVLDRLRETPQQGAPSGGSTRGRVQPLFSATRFAVAAVIVALFGGFLLVAQPFDHRGATAPGTSSEAALPPLTGPAGNGLIAFARDGDIYLGDPATGESGVIVPGQEMDSNPVFSPDGRHIAFVRTHRSREETGQGEVDIVVVEGDGSNERTITPEGIGGDFGPGAWTPDSMSLVVMHSVSDVGLDMGLIILDAAGVADPVWLTPPLPSVGPAPYYDYEAGGVATLFQPPEGDRILGATAEVALLAEMDRDGTDIIDLGALSGLDEIGHRPVTSPSWSPDASRILFAGGWPPFNLYVMDADGSDLRLLTDDGGEFAWSPDGSRVAFQRSVCCEDPAVDPSEHTIVVMDLETGSERMLEATTSPNVPVPVGRHGPFKGWAWSPDGRSILYAPTNSDRLSTVDVETGEATELPWLAERVPETVESTLSAPSWQRVAPD
jgi:dipeptidyl aminopeptidase/acylaminoacyl peptidase